MPTISPDEFTIEIKLLLQAIFEKYNYDFRQYSLTSVHRRVRAAMARHRIETVSRLQEKVLHDPAFFSELLDFLTVPTSEFFRDPSFYLAFRHQVVPMLKTYPSVKIWVAGCSTGEEVYSYAVLLKEEGLLDRTMIYATDINQRSLKKAEQGIFSVEKMATSESNYRKAGGRTALKDYYTESYEAVLFDKNLRKNVVFADHSLSTDQVFSEVQYVSCRNVLIYFDRGLQDRALGLFCDSLCPKGFLALGSKESLRFSAVGPRFEDYCKLEKIYRRRY